MLDRNFNLIQGSLYRSPLRLAEELQGAEKKSWDLGYHHAIRQRDPDDRRAADKGAYAKGFASGRKEQPHPTKNTWTQLGRRGGHLYTKSGTVGRMRSQTRDAALTALKRSGIDVGLRLGGGSFGEVFRVDEPLSRPFRPYSNTPRSVVKLDMSDTEHRIARFIRSDPELKELSILPKIHTVVDTGVIDPDNGRRIHAIHREDVDGLAPGLSDALTRYGRHLNDIAEEVKTKGLGREDALNALDDAFNEVREFSFDPWLPSASIRSPRIRARLEKRAKAHQTMQDRFDRVHAEMRKLVSRGVVPCDLNREDNWGERTNADGSASTVIRDLGCFSVARESGPYQLDSLKDAHLQNPKSMGALSQYMDVLHTSHPDAVGRAAKSDEEAMWAAQEIWHDPAYLMRPDPSSINRFNRRVDDSSHFMRRLSKAVSPDSQFDHNPQDPQSPGTIKLAPHAPRSSAHILTNLIKYHYPGSSPRLTSDETGHRIDIDNLGKLRSRGERLYRTHRPRS